MQRNILSACWFFLSPDFRLDIMQTSCRRFILRLLLATFLCAQLVSGASQAVAGEAPIAFDATWISFDDNFDDRDSDGKDCVGLTPESFSCGVVLQGRRLYLQTNTSLRHSRFTANRYATGPPTA